MTPEALAKLARYVQFVAGTDPDDEHVRNCAVCRDGIRKAREVLALAHGDAEVAAVLWRARELHERSWAKVRGTRRRLARG